MAKINLRNIIKRAIDIHFHIGPEIVPRKFIVADLVEEEKGRIGGLVLKNHFYPTAPFIKEIADLKGIQLFGALVLNNGLGGLNPETIYASAMISEKPVVVWFPTINAKAFLDNSEYEIAPEWVKRKDFKGRLAKDIRPVEVTKNGQLVNEAIKVLKAIKKTGAALATGHISWQESELLAKKARNMGINVVITHPIYQRINMPLKIQQRLARIGCFMEQCYSMYTIDEIPIAQIANQIKEVGSQSVILSSDMGQTFSPNSSEALYQFAELLIKEGINEKELYTMLVENPRKLLGIN